MLEASDGAAAITISNTHTGPINLLLTDVVMPGVNGRELARLVRAARPETRVLYMSGYSEHALARNGVLDEGIALLQKPFTLSGLRDRVREKLSSVVRAQRLNLHVPLKYRLVGERSWRRGTTENISRSGVLFRAEELITPQSQLEINLVLPAEITGLSTSEVVCRGEVVRATACEPATMNPTLAAKIFRYEFPEVVQHAE